MNSPKGNKPATRNDLARVGGKILGRLDARIDGVEKRLDVRIDGVEKRLDDRFGALDAKIDTVNRRLGTEIVAVRFELKTVQERLDRMGNLMTSDEFHRSMDEYAARLEIRDRSREVRLDMWRDHEARISRLEGRSPGSSR